MLRVLQRARLAPGPPESSFAPAQPYESWSLDENYVWQAPTPYPDDGNDYRWDEDTTSWVEVEVE